jgi:hypothetical protein
MVPHKQVGVRHIILEELFNRQYFRSNRIVVGKFLWDFETNVLGTLAQDKPKDPFFT